MTFSRSFLPGLLIGLLPGIVLGFLLGSETPVAPADAKQATAPAAAVAPRSEPPVELPPLPAITRTEVTQSEPAAKSSDAPTSPSPSGDVMRDLLTAAITGLVVDQQGSPVPGALVTLADETRESPRGPQPDAGRLRVRTTGSGRFVFAGLDVGTRYRLQAEPVASYRFDLRRRDREQHSIEAVAPSGEVAVPLFECRLEIELIAAPAEVHDGVVRDLRVECRGANRSSSSGGTMPSRFSIALTPGDAMTLTVSGERFRSETFPDLVLGEGEVRPIQVTLRPRSSANSLSLVVKDDRGVAVPTISLRDVTGESRSHRAWDAGNPRSDEHGNYRIDSLETGERTFLIKPPGDSPLVARMVTVNVPEIGEVRESVVLKTGGYLRVRVPPTAGQSQVTLQRLGSEAAGEIEPDLTEIGAQFSHGNSWLEPGKSYRRDAPLEPSDYEICWITDDEKHAQRFTITATATTEITLGSP